MKIILDAMGGDNAPDEIVKGAAQAVAENRDNLTLVLVGNEETIRASAEHGAGVLVTTHHLSEAEQCDRIAIIKDGRIVSEFVADDLRHASLKYYTVRFGNEEDERKFECESKKLPSLTVSEKRDGELKMSLEDKDLNAFIALLSDCNAKEFSNRRETLEDYFMKFYKEDKDFGGALK